MARIKRRQRRIILFRSNQSASVSSADLNHAIPKTEIPAQETIALRMMPKTKTIPPSQALNRPDRRTGKLALMDRPATKTWRMTIT